MKGKTWRVLLGIKIKSSGNPLAVQWLGPRTFTTGTHNLGELRSHKPCASPNPRKKKTYNNNRIVI